MGAKCTRHRAASELSVWPGRLAHLNKVYSLLYSGLPYITFVNGRPRSAIVTEMEAHMGLSLSPDPLPMDFPTDQPALDDPALRSRVCERGSDAWKVECERALGDVWRIARSRVDGMGLR